MAYPRALPAASKQFKPPRRFSGRSDSIPFTPAASRRWGSIGSFRNRLPIAAKNRVGHRWNDGRSSSLAHSARRLRTLDNVTLDGRCLIHAQHLVAIEVGLLDTAGLQRDLTIECRRDVEDDGALDLRVDGIGIDHTPHRRTLVCPPVHLPVTRSEAKLPAIDRWGHERREPLAAAADPRRMHKSA